MTFKNAENVELLQSKFDEICFKCLTFRCIASDHCLKTDTCLKENHGYSNLLRMNIHLYNFRPFVFANYCYVLFLSICILSIIRWQQILSLKSSNAFLNFIELHIMSFTNIFTEGDIRMVPLLIIEAIWLYFGSRIVHHLYCIGS